MIKRILAVAAGLAACLRLLLVAPAQAASPKHYSSDLFVQKDLGTFATPAEAEKAVLAASKTPVFKSAAQRAALDFDQCNQGEAARVCAEWDVIPGASGSGWRWDLDDEHNWNPGPYGTVGFKAKFHSGFVAPEQLANLGVTRCWADHIQGPSDACNHDISSDMGGYWTNTFQVCPELGERQGHLHPDAVRQGHQ